MLIPIFKRVCLFNSGNETADYIIVNSTQFCHFPQPLEGGATHVDFFVVNILISPPLEGGATHVVFFAVNILIPPPLEGGAAHVVFSVVNILIPPPLEGGGRGWGFVTLNLFQGLYVGKMLKRVQHDNFYHHFYINC